MLKDYLEGRNIAYDEKLVDQDENAKDEMAGESGGFLGVPFTVIVKGDGTKETIIGFDKGKLDGILGINS